MEILKASATTCADSGTVISNLVTKHERHSSHQEEIYRLTKVSTLKEKVKEEHRQPIKRLYEAAFESESSEIPTDCNFIGMRSTLYRARRSLLISTKVAEHNRCDIQKPIS